MSATAAKTGISIEELEGSCFCIFWLMVVYPFDDISNIILYKRAVVKWCGGYF